MLASEVSIEHVWCSLRLYTVKTDDIELIYTKRHRM
jgi:hypothetical protein